MKARIGSKLGLKQEVRFSNGGEHRSRTDKRPLVSS